MTVQTQDTYGSYVLVAAFLPGDPLGGTLGQPALNTPAPATPQLYIKGHCEGGAPYFSFVDRAELTFTWNGGSFDTGVLTEPPIPGTSFDVIYNLDPTNDVAFWGALKQHILAPATYPLVATWKCWFHTDGPGTPLVDLTASEDEVIIPGSQPLILHASHGNAGYLFPGE